MSNQNSTANPLVPTDVSAQCSEFLTSLDSDASLAACIKPVITATSKFGPSATTTNFSTSDVSSALDSLCSNPSTSCADTIRAQLASFYTACTPELTGTNPSKDALRTYDTLYAFIPFQNTLCSKDETGTYCPLKVSLGSPAANSSSSTGPLPSGAVSHVAVSSGPSPADLVLNNLWGVAGTAGLKRRDTVTVVQNYTAALVPNTTTFRTSGLCFLFLTPQTNPSTLCTSCTRTIVSNYIDFEQSVIYAPGLQNSLLLGGQPALYSAIQTECGANFMSGAVQAAGGISNGLISGAQRISGSEFASVSTLLAAAIAGLSAML